VTKAYHIVYEKGLVYQLEPETLCTFDRVFRKHLLTNFSNNLSRNSTISTRGNSNEGLELECDELPQSFDFAMSQNNEAHLTAEFE